MKRSSFVVGLAAAGMMAAIGGAASDETWSTNTTEVQWAQEGIGGYSVFTYQVKAPDGFVLKEGQMFVEGLFGSDTQRGTYNGYWTETGDGVSIYCPMAVLDANGVEVWTWGSLVLTFDGPTFPSGWTAEMGDCMGPATRSLTVSPPL